MTKTKIEWADEVWNPVTGCTKVSEGCRHCYAETMAKRFWTKDHIELEYVSGVADNDIVREVFVPRDFTEVRCHPERLDQPLHWRKPRKVFVNSMSDLFHDDVPDEFISAVWMRMIATPQHNYQILTKRPSRMLKIVNNLFKGLFDRMPHVASNVWLGVSVEDQKTADERIPLLLQTSAVVRFVSCEPLLGSINLDN